MAAVCTITPAATFSRAGCTRERSAWNSKKPGRASASESWTKDKLAARTSSSVPGLDKLVARTSSSVPGRASLSDNWIRDKAARKEIGIEHVEQSPSREIISQIGGKAEKEEISVERAGQSPSREIGAKRALSRAPSAEVERSEKESEARGGCGAGGCGVLRWPGVHRGAAPSELPLPTFPLFVESPDPSELPIPKFLKARKQADDS
ncbi:hypothetical protein GQ55_9G439800 [Panicum hallii var. hallii]|uniref:Uncharacterized protein n=1 Tax=Panicum hallii var. hallii TaxID=1504633 RepID=A0A2T7CBB5_9POAL|nr:hypothetical protein GQ55_9G439800 [Panicum hallii var. hallii]